MKRIAFLLSVLTIGVGGVAQAETIRMDEMAVEGEVHKPEVLFITDRGDRVPERDGIKRLRENFLAKTILESRSMAKQEAR